MPNSPYDLMPGEDPSTYDDQDIDQNYPYGVEDIRQYGDQDFDQGYHPNMEGELAGNEQTTEEQLSDEELDQLVNSLTADDQMRLRDALQRALQNEDMEDEVPVDPETGEPIYDDTLPVPGEEGEEDEEDLY